MYICTHFKIEELVPPEIITKYGSSQAWSLLTDPIKQTADMIRNYFNDSMFINRPPQQTQRGLRTPASADYSPTSQHALGNAIDFDLFHFTPALIRETILAHPNDPAFEMIGGLEDFVGMSWVHVDCRPRLNNQILVFSK